VQVAGCEGAAGSLCNAKYAPGVVRIVGASLGRVSGRGTLATLTVVGLGQGEKTSALTLTPITLTDPNGVGLR
jgi:hypothetical protein